MKLQTVYLKNEGQEHLRFAEVRRTDVPRQLAIFFKFSCFGEIVKY